MQNFSFKIKLPVNVFQTKKSKVLLSLNKVIGLNGFVWNKIKKNYTDEVIKALPKDLKQIHGIFETIMIYNYKNKNSDLSNITPVISKIVLDVLQELDLIEEDNVKHHLKNSDIVGSKVEDPHIIFIIRKIQWTELTLNLK
jgi:hypothetical protein